jgi:hypothetical protein
MNQAQEKNAPSIFWHHGQSKVCSNLSKMTYYIILSQYLKENGSFPDGHLAFLTSKYQIYIHFYWNLMLILDRRKEFKREGVGITTNGIYALVHFILRQNKDVSVEEESDNLVNLLIKDRLSLTPVDNVDNDNRFMEVSRDVS